MSETTPTGWTKRHDGVWEAMIDGTTHLIARDGDMFYVYRSLGWEQIDTAPTLIEAMVKAEGIDHV